MPSRCLLPVELLSSCRLTLGSGRRTTSLATRCKSGLGQRTRTTSAVLEHPKCPSVVFMLTYGVQIAAGLPHLHRPGAWGQQHLQGRLDAYSQPCPRLASLYINGVALCIMLRKRESSTKFITLSQFGSSAECGCLFNLSAQNSHLLLEVPQLRHNPQDVMVGVSREYHHFEMSMPRCMHYYCIAVAVTVNRELLRSPTHCQWSVYRGN